MVTRLRAQIGTAGLVVAVVALVVALAGGAFAASGGGPFAGSSKHLKGASQGLTKRQVIALIEAHSAPGPQGPEGQPGPAGKDGLNGKDGTASGKDGVDGKDGTDGTSVVTYDLEPGEAGCPAGGVEFESASGYNVVCDGVIGKDGKEGKDGSPWTAGGTLPPGATETGSFSEYFKGEVFIPISFPIPLPSALPAANVHKSGDSDFATVCQGTAAEPQANAGQLCVYVAENYGPATLLGPFPSTASYGEFAGSGGGLLGAATAGAILYGAASESLVWGTWAVTAPAPTS